MGFRIKVGSRSGSSPMGVVGKLFSSLFFLPFFLMGLFFIIMMLKEWSSQRALNKWTETPCKIIESEVRDVRGGYAPYVKYEYMAGGQEWESERFTNVKQALDHYSEVEAMIRPYPAGATSTCRVDPQNPNEAVILVQVQTWLLFATPFPLIFVLVGLGGIYAIWKKENKAKQPVSQGGVVPDKAIGNANAKNKKSGLLFGALFFVIGATMFYFMTLVPMSNLIRAQGWEEVTCVIESSQVIDHPGDDGTTYSIDIRYRYNINNQDYPGDRYNFMFGSSSGSSGKQKIIRQYKPGTEKTCYVNPDEFTESVLNRSLSASYLWCLFPLPFAGAGLAVIIGTVRSGKRRTFKRSKAQRPVSELSSASDPDDWRGVQNQETTAGGRVILKPAAGRIGSLIGVIFFCLFWNGIVSIFLMQAINGFKNGRSEWFLAIFLIPFVLVGIGSMVAVVYCFLGLFNAKPIVTVNKASYVPGDTIEMDWKFNGNVYAIKHITIRLEGREEAKYQRGTNTYTDKRTFFRKTMLDSDDRGHVLGGMKKVTIPEGTMHSFDGGNNKIIWQLTLHGDIKNWPDVDQKYAIDILPKGLMQ